LVFLEEGELLLEGNSETMGSFRLTIPSESRAPFFLHKNTIHVFAKNVAKHYKMTQTYVLGYLEEHPELSELLRKSVALLGSKQGHGRKTLHDFGADEELYSSAAVKNDLGKKLGKQLEDTKAQLEDTPSFSAERFGV
jgi:hypothetical protein